MSTRVVDRVDTWDEQSFSGGYRELHELADSEFSGVVRAGGAELYMTRGVAVGLRMGEIEDLENAGTVYEAPAEALPLLAIMQERNDEVKAKYYTEKTSISKVDKTLTDGGFTGFIELSENVLSGDYYIVYQAGKSMSVAYVGESSRLLSGDEAFETADGEVGIYKVRPAEIEPVEIPEPESEAEPETEKRTEATGADDSDEAQAQPEGTQTNADSASESSDSPSVQTGTQSETTAANAESTSSTEAQPTTDGDRSSATETDTQAADQNAQSERETGGGGSAGGSEAGTSSTTKSEQRSRRDQASTEAEQQSANSPERGQRGDSPRRTQSPQERPSDGVGTARTHNQRQRQPPKGSQSPPTSQSLETKSIPSLDPDRTEIPDQTSTKGTGIPQSRPERSESPEPAPQQRTQTAEPQHNSTQQQQSQPPEPQPREPAAESKGADQSDPREAESSVETERLETLETELEEKEAEIERLEDELETATSDREELTEQVQSLEAERNELETERKELQSEVTHLETELERLEEELGAATDAERRITAGEALAGTDIFVRYRSKGKGTLEKAHGSSTRKDDVNENLRLEKHTQFDASTVAVGGQSYDEFLESTLEYQFVRWVVRELLFEIRDTGHEKELADLYGVLPQIDRAELSGVVDVVYTEDGQETQSQESFDVVLRNRMGHPLLAANLNDTREATTESMMERLITSAERVGQSSETFSGAFLVTESFFDPGALEVASSATQGGLLSRDKRKSFVNLSRKSGYHLCLVEARNENFHLAVPEL